MNSAETDIIIRIPQNLYDEHVQRLIDYVEYKKIVSKSKATQKDIDKLVAEIKKERKPKIEALKKRLKLD
ncbi:MAG TPA: hypothetical protein VHB70_00605 [Parafilimonas sp.]|jgi:hypothetical protein|nr:hypothetical protein [Parafilimonas sp.]